MNSAPSPPKPPAVLPFLIIAYALGGLLATDTYLPSMPLLAREFGTTDKDVQFTLSAYLAGITIANLFYGPLSDRYGRRPIMLLGGVAFLVATFVCALAISIEMLTFGRFAQGAAVCSLTVTARATIRELYDDARTTKLNAYIAMAEGLAPAVGPIIGAEILLLLGWRWNFYLVAGMAGLALIGLFFALPESNTQPNPYALQPGPMARIYGRLLTTRDFIGPVGASGLIFGGLMLYITAAPFLLIDEMGLTPRQFGQTQAAVVLTYIAGLIGTSRLIGRIGPKPMLNLGLLFVTVGGVGMLVMALSGFTGFWGFVAPFGFYTLGIGVAMAPMLTWAMSANRAATGSVAALLGTVTMACAFLGSHTAIWIYNGETLPIAMAIAGISCAAVLVYGLSRLRIGRRR